MKEENKMNKGYGICRVSSVSQSDNTSLNNQKNKIEQYCELNDVKLVEIIEEIYTGTTSNRDSLNHVKELVEKGECDTVVVYKLDRLMRNFTEGVVFLKYLLDNEVKIMSVSEQIDTSSISGRFLINILLSMSEMEKDTIVQRLNNGKIEKFQDSKKVNGRICYGYKKYNGEIVIDEEESKIVKYIFKKYNQLRHRIYYSEKELFRATDSAYFTCSFYQIKNRYQANRLYSAFQSPQLTFYALHQENVRGHIQPNARNYERVIVPTPPFQISYSLGLVL